MVGGKIRDGFNSILAQLYTSLQL